MVSRGNKGYKITVYLRAGHSFKTSSESPHEALASLRDDERSQWTFYDRYGAVHTKKELVEPKQWSELLQAEPFKNLPSPELMAPLINLGVPADVDEQFKKFVSAQETAAAVARAAGQPCPYVDLELRDLLRQAWRWDIASLDKIEQVACQDMKFTWHFNKRGRVELVANDLWNVLCVLFLRDHWEHKTAICTNPDCPNPYFIKRRKTQKYCGTWSCAAQAQREQKRLWWVENYGKRAKR